ncbi:PEP-CTERM sorting domain-containing protein [Massilia niabensis]|uniref:PEP-CTERM sorting domain-containing protein n=1 Tax=Massilia niabensis TaxID=544910 RepID=A0ABW0L144_9BURK
MNIKSYLAAAGLCLLPLLSHAGIIYEWTGTNAQTPSGITLQLEFDHRTVQAGSFQLDFDHLDGNVKAPKRGLLSLRYTFPGMDQLMDYSAKGGRGFDNNMGFMRMDLTFEDGFLTGSIHANDQFHHVDMASTGREFTVIDANSDEGMPGAECGWQDDIVCQGATGYLQRVRETEVPEPASIALLAVGVAGLASARRRKSA